MKAKRAKDNGSVPTSNRKRWGTRGSRRLVLADDDPGFREYVALVLRRAGYEVVEAADGPTLLECLDIKNAGPDWRVPFDVVVTDFQMPGITGIEVLEGLALAGLADRVVLISGFADGDTMQWARKMGAAATLSKPFRRQGKADRGRGLHQD